MLDGHTGVADPRDASPDLYGVGVLDLPAEVATDGGEAWAGDFLAMQPRHADAVEIGHARRFEPAEIDHVVDVAKQVLVAPVDGPFDDNGKLVGRHSKA